MPNARGLNLQNASTIAYATIAKTVHFVRELNRFEPKT